MYMYMRRGQVLKRAYIKHVCVILLILVISLRLTSPRRANVVSLMTC